MDRAQLNLGRVSATPDQLRTLARLNREGDRLILRGVRQRHEDQWQSSAPAARDSAAEAEAWLGWIASRKTPVSVLPAAVTADEIRFRRELCS